MSGRKASGCEMNLEVNAPVVDYMPIGTNLKSRGKVISAPTAGALWKERKTMRMIDGDAVLATLRLIDRKHADPNNADEHFINGIETAIEVIENTASAWHLVKSREDLPKYGIPVIVEYDKGVTVAILDDAWVKNQPMWYVNNEPIGMWCAVNRWMEIPK